MRKKIIGGIALGLLGVLTLSSCNLFTNNGNNSSSDSSNGSDAVTVTYTVTFDSKGGSSVDSQTVNKGSKVTKPSDPTRSGYTFAGWYKEEAYTNLFNFDTTTITSNRTLYAKWNSNSSGGDSTTQYSVTFNMNGHGTTPASQTITSGGKVTEPTVPSASGYSFGGWYKEAACTNAWNFNTDTVSGAITLYAKWTSQSQSGFDINQTVGYNEAIYFTFNTAQGKTNSSDYVVSYKKSGGSYKTLDSELVRINNGTGRADILGLEAGNYDIKITCSGVEKTASNIAVVKQDRSGYAHFDSSTSTKMINTGIGAYNNDGTLKSNAEVLYVTNENKNTITYNGHTGLVEIIQAQTNSSKPLDIRIIGSIKTNQFNVKSSAPRLADNSNLSSDFFTNTLETTYGENLVGLTIRTTDKKELVSTYYKTTKTGFSFDKSSSTKEGTTEYGRSEYPDITGKTVYDDDSYFNMLDVTNASNITIEGIGDDAELFQWGFTWDKCNSIEVKNLTFTDYPEDACSVQGDSNANNKTGIEEYKHFWIHNNTFNRGKNNWDISGERDKYAGDGAMDLKFLCNVTASYNKYNNCKKTGLVGGGDSNYQKDITFHHNYYYRVESRLPLGRRANLHIYNNYYDNCGTCMDLRANAYVLSESNYFKSCSNPQKVQSGAAIKSYNDYGGINSFKVDTRTTSVTNSCMPDGSTDYSSFDTSTTLFYYDSTNQKSNVSIMNNASDLPTLIPNVAGAGLCAKLTY